MHTIKVLLHAVLALAIGLLMGSVASAQTPPIKNPSRAVFTPMDYPIVTSFDLGYFLIVTRADGTCDASSIPLEPIQLETLGKPALRPDGDVEQLLSSRPAIGCFVAKVLARAGALSSPWSDPSDPFQLVPLQQGKPTMR